MREYDSALVRHNLDRIEAQWMTAFGQKQPLARDRRHTKEVSHERYKYAKTEVQGRTTNMIRTKCFFGDPESCLAPVLGSIFKSGSGR